MDFGHKSGNSIQWYSNQNYKKCHGKRNGASKSKQRLVQHNGAENKRSIYVSDKKNSHSVSNLVQKLFASTLVGNDIVIRAYSLLDNVTNYLVGCVNQKRIKRFMLDEMTV